MVWVSPRPRSNPGRLAGSAAWKACLPIVRPTGWVQCKWEGRPQESLPEDVFCSGNKNNYPSAVIFPGRMCECTSSNLFLNSSTRKDSQVQLKKILVWFLFIYFVIFFVETLRPQNTSAPDCFTLLLHRSPVQFTKRRFSPPFCFCMHACLHLHTDGK